MRCPTTEFFLCGRSSKTFLLASLSGERCSGGQLLSTFSDSACAGGLLQEAHDLFGSTGINITTEGRPVLGAPCGQEEYCRSFCASSLEQWVLKVSKLARFAKTQPHAAHVAFTHGLSSEWTYLSRSVQSLEEYLQPLEDVIRSDLLPSLTGRAVSDLERRLLSPPPPPPSSSRRNGRVQPGP